jgi:putative hydrolase of the HAD superfamily
MKKIVFDFGGVMLRWRPLEFLPRLLPELATSAQATQALARVIFQGFGGNWGEFDRGVIDAEALAQRIAARTGLDVYAMRHLIDSIPAELQPLPESVGLLRRLHETGRELHFLSNMPEPYARHIEATHEFVALFRSGVYSARVQMVKPDPAIFEHARALFGGDAARLVFIDDVQKNVVAARACGWQAIEFRDAAQCEAELHALGVL